MGNEFFFKKKGKDLILNITSSNCCFNENIKLFISSDCQLQVARSYSSHFEILRSIAGKLQHFSCQIFQNCSRVYSSCCTNTVSCTDAPFQKSVNSAYWKLLQKEKVLDTLFFFSLSNRAI